MLLVVPSEMPSSLIYGLQINGVGEPHIQFISFMCHYIKNSPTFYDSYV